MTKKKTFIILAVIFTIFTIAMAIVVINHYNKDSNIETIVEENYAVNETKPKEETTIYKEESYTKVVNDVVYQNLDNLNYEQQADKNDLIKLVRDNMVKEEAEYGKAVSVEVLSASDDQFAYVLVTFANDQTQEYILVYDDVNTHSFLNCQTVEQWEFYHSDSNKG